MILAHSAEYNRDGSIKINYQLYYTHIYNGKKIIDFILNDFFIDNFQDSFNLIKDFSKLKVAFIQALKIAWEYHDFGKLDNQCQNILSGKLKNVKMLNHVDAGVAFLCKKYKDTNNALFLFSAFLILAHHIGLPNIENIIKDNRE